MVWTLYYVLENTPWSRKIAFTGFGGSKPKSHKGENQVPSLLESLGTKACKSSFYCGLLGLIQVSSKNYLRLGSVLLKSGVDLPKS